MRAAISAGALAGGHLGVGVVRRRFQADLIRHQGPEELLLLGLIEPPEDEDFHQPVPGMPALEFLAAAPLPLIFPLIGVVDMEDDQAGLELQGFLQDHLAAPGPIARQGQIDRLAGNVVPPQFLAQEPG